MSARRCRRFSSHAALFEANRWVLMAWLGHKRLDDTVRYVHMADAHWGRIPEEILVTAAGETDPTRRNVNMLGARGAPRADEAGQT